MGFRCSRKPYLTVVSNLDLLENLESLAMEACLTIPESTLQGMVLGCFLSTTSKEQSDVLETLVSNYESEVFNRPSLEDFVEANISMLNSVELDFRMLVSEDDTPEVRLTELSDWVDGFLESYASDDSNDEVEEILGDFRAVRDVDTEIGSDSGIAESDLEQMVEECVEHVRVSTMLLYELKR